MVLNLTYIQFCKCRNYYGAIREKGKEMKQNAIDEIVKLQFLHTWTKSLDGLLHNGNQLSNF